jgi:16S rRNA (cytosine967-C5)-methyltransferase
VEYLSVFYSYPEWLVQKWIRERGVDFAEALLGAQNRIPTLTVRTNSLKISRSDLIHRLEAEKGIVGKPTPYSPQGVRLEDFRGRVDQYKAFQDGLFQVQDEAAQLTSILVSPVAGDTVLDLCAGYGGKTTHLAELMGIRVSDALDMNRTRLSLRQAVRLRLAPAGCGGPQETFLPFRALDRIVVDAPCSASG